MYNYNNSNSIAKQNLLHLASNPASELYVLRHDGDPLGVNSTEVGVLEQADQVRLGGLLKSENGAGLEAKFRFIVLRDFADQALKGLLADQKFS